MNSGVFKEKTSLPLYGRGLLIMTVIFFSSLSFTLGYFVGKNITEKRPEVVSQISEPAPLPQNQESGQVVSDRTADAPVQNNALASEEKPESKQAVVQIPAAPPAKKGPEPALASVSVPSADAVKEHPKAAPKENASSGPSKIAPREGDVTYTVQLGAFKSAPEARRLKTKLEKKGYRTQITTSTNKTKHERIYKIRTGAFDDKKDAEMLALKLKKTEGLNAFVTPRN
jgi:cell division septation protein DedD